jgi:hypothetical protein
MRVTVLAGILLLATPAHAADKLPDAMMGNWSMGDEEGIMERVDKDKADFIVEKDKYYAVDAVCTILHTTKMSEYDYIVQSRCAFDGDDPLIEPRTGTSEFELKRDKLRVSPVDDS